MKKKNEKLVGGIVFPFCEGGEPAEVYWTSNAYHRGGYAYRLCKVDNKEYWKVTEQCFQRGHLNFSGGNFKYDFFLSKQII